MLFTSPHYPLFLAAVFLLYGLARSGRWPGVIARLALMLVLGDVVWLSFTHDTARLWDPLGGLAFGALPDASFPPWWRLPLGLGAFAGAVYLGVLAAARPIEARQPKVALAMLGAVVATGAVVLIGWLAGGNLVLEAIAHALGEVGHLAWLTALGVALGAASTERGRVVGRVLILLLVSAVFYHAWAAAQHGAYKYLLALIVFTIVLDYYLALAIERTEDRWRKKGLLVVSLVSNLGILFVFKYADFFRLDVLGLDAEPWKLLLPAGISFHTFQSMSYTIEVYRKEIRATRSVTELATFVLFFPQLVAGPIVRANELLPQIRELPPFDHRLAADGLYRIVIGLFKKIALADFLATALADRVFKDPSLYSSVEVLVGVYAYAFQIYLDFSAYSDIAIGSAQLLGFRMPENFETPYRSGSLQEFWRRWHMTLSRWLRDYLYVPLGGNRGGELATYRNLILTMVLGGLWHGASWNFIVWGLLHGVGLAVTRYYQRVCQVDRLRGQRLLLGCACVFFAGAALHGSIGRALIDDTWLDLTLMWLYTVPVWAAATVWLTRGEAPPVGQTVSAASAADLVLVLRAIGGAAVIGLMLALHEGVHWAWLPFALVSLIAAWAADVAEVNPSRDGALRWLGWAARRAIAVVLVFHYVCLAWVFFRAQTFDGALAVLARLGAGETDHPNLIAPIQLALVVAAGAHFFAPRTLAWWRARFVSAPTWAQGLVLAGCAEALRGLAVPHIVPFIYFQF